MSTPVLVVAEQLRRQVSGGIGTYVDSLLRRLAARDDVDAEVWASRLFRGKDPLGAYDLPVRCATYPSRVLSRLWDRGYAAPPAGRSIVHATSVMVPPKAKRLMTAMVHDIAWRSFPDAYPPRGRAWHEAALGRTMERADTIFTPSVQTANDLVGDGVDRDRVVVVPLGSDHLPPPDKASAEAVLRRAGVDGPFLLAVGTLEPRKNLSRVMAAYAKVRPSLPAAMPLVVVGPHGWGNEVRPVDGVVLTGGVDAPALAALYELCHVFVSAPLVEGFGLPALEAMHAGAPVMSSPIPSVGDASYIVDPSSVVAIAEGIGRVANDDVLRRQLADRGLVRAGRLTWEATVDAHVRAWDALWRR
jgi:glycosyltransferase involved in cell wall biosynthesis